MNWQRPSDRMYLGRPRVSEFLSKSMAVLRCPMVSVWFLTGFLCTKTFLFSLHGGFVGGDNLGEGVISQATRVLSVVIGGLRRVRGHDMALE